MSVVVFVVLAHDNREAALEDDSQPIVGLSALMVRKQRTRRLSVVGFIVLAHDNREAALEDDSQPIVGLSALMVRKTKMQAT